MEVPRSESVSLKNRSSAYCKKANLAQRPVLISVTRSGNASSEPGAAPPQHVYQTDDLERVETLLEKACEAFDRVATLPNKSTDDVPEDGLDTAIRTGGANHHSYESEEQEQAGDGDEAGRNTGPV